MNVQIITIGDELLIGQVIDTNSAWMATELNLLGFNVRKIVTVSDEHQEIIGALNEVVPNSDIVLMTGGLGPTKDDITKKAIADLLNVGLAFHHPTYERIQSIFEKLGKSITPSHKEQCFMPVGTKFLKNRMGTAPGMMFRSNNTLLVSMPGVPYEMKSIMEKELLPMLKEKSDGQAIEHRTLLTVGEGESRIALKIEDFVEKLPEHIKIAYLPGMGSVRLRLTGRSNNPDALKEEMDTLSNKLYQEIPHLVSVSYTHLTLPTTPYV